MNNLSIAIVGGGASGLMCSIMLSRAGFKVCVYEKNTKIGRKILATGNGRCNISNQNVSLSNFNSTDIEFVKYPLSQFNYQKFQQFFEQLGLDLVTGENSRVYPMSLQASSVVDLLVYEAKRVGVEFILNTQIQLVKFENDKFILEYGKNQKEFTKVIIASGTNAMPKLGSSDSGYKFAKSFGHNIIKPFASLVQLKSDCIDTKSLSGVKIDSKVDLEINKEFSQSALGDVLFTVYGISGNAILDISREASYSLSIGSRVVVNLDIFPNISKDILISKLTKRLKNSNDKDKYFWLEGFIHKKLIKFVIDNCGIKKDKSKADELNRKDIMSLVYFMKNMKININDTKGFETAEVSAGGVDVSQVESKTMQSKLQKGLYFTGEVLDVDGQCGGYNLHWAWASGYVCANSIIGL
ncbi:MAG: NAD(P)/FAD-dependent oxidoreductase [Arcobacteraceae bacterium]|nr:NAD(P)/FAD-dependent oxidoreductase [Arcobacteraceae bacterium]